MDCDIVSTAEGYDGINGHMIIQLEGVYIEPQTGGPYHFSPTEYVTSVYGIEKALNIALNGVFRSL